MASVGGARRPRSNSVDQAASDKAQPRKIRVGVCARDK